MEIQGNQISSLPASFSGLANLKLLNIARNNFTELPAWLCLTPRMEVIDASDNKITSIPECLTTITTLKEIRLNKKRANCAKTSETSVAWGYWT
ncbi:MAG: hypothetical protein IPP17_27235 [Bacteroidetes bacterium]|nr:hypothetical protein [Bacteroidota bacterium]